jgi:hypothetical protein
MISDPSRLIEYREEPHIRVKGDMGMQTRQRLLGSIVCLALIFLLSPPARGQSAYLSDSETSLLLDEIRDLDLLRQNIEDCYSAVKRYEGRRFVSDEAAATVAELDVNLVRRVFSRLSRYPEYKQFTTKYREFRQDAGYRRLHADELFAVYVRLLDTGRARLLRQWGAQRELVPKGLVGKAFPGVPEASPHRIFARPRQDFVNPVHHCRAVPAVLLRLDQPFKENGSLPSD